MALKVWIHVDNGDGDPQRVCWYMGTSDVMVENAIRMQLHLARSARFLLRDSDGDLVPVSSTLPHDQTYQLVQVHDAPDRTFDAYDTEQCSHNGQYQSRPKRRRRLANGSTAATVSTEELRGGVPDVMDGYNSHHGMIPPDQYMFSQSDDLNPSSALASTPAASHRPRSVVYIVTRFLETFTRAIPNDDNVNFIPNTGPYALYALYCHLFPDTAYHPKTQNSFYKMTSLQGKVDRQRVIRYYQHHASHSGVNTVIATQSTTIESNSGDGGGLEVVLFKPEGKGPLLRKYVNVGIDISAAELVRAADFVAVLDLNPQEIIAKYSSFIDGFQPIAKATYQAHTKSTESTSSPPS